jgi:hypothetical protein
MSPLIEGLVETSNNLAIVEIRNGLLQVLSSQRSSARSQLEEHTARIEALALPVGSQTCGSAVVFVCARARGLESLAAHLPDHGRRGDGVCPPPAEVTIVEMRAGA